jgi:hypothetical protein
MNDPTDSADLVHQASWAFDTAARACDTAARACQAVAVAIRHARRWSRRFGDADDLEAMEALATALGTGSEANRASLRATLRGWKAGIFFEELPELGYLIDEGRSIHRSASMEFTARGINDAERCPGTMPGLNTLLPFELEEYETLRRSNRSQSSRRDDDLRRVYTELAANWRRAAATEHGEVHD